MLVTLGEAAACTCGAKATTLGALLRAGLPVPEGFVVPFDAYRAATRDPDGRLAPPVWLGDVVARGLRMMGDGPVAVRSSASDEDGAGGSAAGQHDSVLAVQGAHAVVQAVLTCWASLHSPRATAYRRRTGDDGTSERPVMAVLVQRFVDPDVAGVMFTPSDDDAATRIEASWGLGAGVVGGTVTPDAYRVGPDGSITGTIADKRVRRDRSGAGTVVRDVTAALRRKASLDDPSIRRIARLGQRVAEVLGGPQDIEWALTGDRIWILQARPLTADVPQPGPRPTGAPARWTGTPASHGTATGTARIVRGPHDFPRVRRGDILVCPFTDPAWTPLLAAAGGVVTEIGGALSHAAIIARERGIPAVLSVPAATSTLPDGALVTIDGTAGTVTTIDT